MEKAIKIAIENGYEKTHKNWLFAVNMFNESALFLDPLFWQALEKGLGWQEANKYGYKPTPEGRQIWQEQMHSFTDHLIAEKPPESFFEELLNKN